MALTGYGTTEDRTRARDAGFDAHLTKPVEPRQLSEVLAGVDPASPTTRDTRVT